MSLLSAAAIDAAKEIAVSSVKKWLSTKSKKEQDLMSIGLAVGYFFNFLDPLNDVLNNNVLDLYTPVDRKEATIQSPKKVFEIDDVYVEIIIPKRLDAEARKACNNEFKNSVQGFFYIQRHDRFYGINYYTSKVGSIERLHIIDLTRPAFAVQRYYEDVLGLRTFNSDPKWHLTQVSELTAFEETIINLGKLGDGTLTNKLSFKHIG